MKVLQTAGFDKIIEEENVKFVDMNYGPFFDIELDGPILKSTPLNKVIEDADVIISLPKLKTHAMTSYTGAVKNLFGTIPGTYKAELHFRLNERKSFCSMLVDLHECVKPTLSIMDAVWGMEATARRQVRTDI